MKPRNQAVTVVTFFLLTTGAWARQQASAGPVKVFILAGQSNMQGAGAVRSEPEHNGGRGSLEYLVEDPASAARYAHLVDDEGDWVVRDDVWICGRNEIADHWRAFTPAPGAHG